MELLRRLFDTEGFPPRWHCGTGWTPALGWVHILSDIAIWGSYIAIPFVLAFFVIRRRDVPFPRVFWLFIAFIFFCGTGHLIEAIIFWQPVYRLAGFIKLGTAIVSVATVLALVPAIPAALSLRSPEELEREVDLRTRSLQESEARQRVMMNELDHRVKNNIAAIVSLADQTIASTSDVHQFREAFMGRLAALNRMHQALSAARWSGADVAHIVALTIDPYSRGRLNPPSIGGPTIHLDSKAASSLCMALHELATNSVKYGALSLREGSIDLHWSLTGDGLEFRWAERGGPAVTPPTRQGFGTTLIKGVIEYDLDGVVQFTFAPDGLRCTIVIPSARFTSSDEAGAGSGEGDSRS